MLHVERLEKIKAYIIENKFANINELAAAFNTSTATIRRCLKQLEEEKMVESVRGGAVLASSGSISEHPYQVKRQQNIEEKERIAQEACKYINSNDSIFLDSSSTVFEMAKYLRPMKNITISTNDVTIASALSQSNGLVVTVTGGTLRNNYYTLTGFLAEKALEQMRMDCAFMGVDTIDAKGGFMITNTEEIGIKRRAAASANRVVVLCDHTKFNRPAFLSVWERGMVDVVITGKELDPETYKTYTELGLNIKLV